MPEIRIAALDLDGTLLSRENTVTPATRQAISDAVARGVVVLPATGRALANLPPLVAQLPGVRYAITSNGAAVWDLYQEFEGSLSVFSDGRVIRDPLAQERMGNHQRRLLSLSTEAKQPNDGRFHIVRDTAEWMSRHAHEVEKFCMFFHSVKEAQQYLPRFTAIEGVEVVQGSPDNIEVTAAGVNKGESLLALADHLGIPREATLAVGDSENDRAMLEKAGVAAVMANGMEQIRKLADIVSENDNDHDGVAEIFARLGL